MSPARRFVAASMLLAAASLTACGGGAGPSPQPPVISAISPDAGSVLGGTRVTIAGANFASSATVSIGGVAATAVNVQSPTALSAVTGPHAAGRTDVTVTVGGMTATLSGAFTYAVPGPSDNPPPIVTLDARGSRKNEPSQFADLDEEIAVTATVTDKETPVEQLDFEWTAEAGTLTGTGPAVSWRAPAQGTPPFSSIVRVAVTERYVTTEGAVHENRVEASVTIQVHDSVREVGEMATRFLENFSKSSVRTSVVMQDFLAGCYGTSEERDQVEANREHYTITSWSVGSPQVTVNFGGVCSFRSRPGDACSRSEVRWDSTRKSTGEKGSVSGVDQVAAVYRNNRWWLCDSQFEGHSLLGNGFYELLTR